MSGVNEKVDKSLPYRNNGTETNDLSTKNAWGDVTANFRLHQQAFGEI